MRLIHTSDWHLGQYFYGKSREAEHRAFFDWLLSQIKQHQVDVLIVSGDIFDTGAPPSYARTLLSEFMAKLHLAKCQMVLVAGNHDSVSVLNESQSLLHHLGIQVIANASENIEKQIVAINNSENECLGFVCAVPFIRPRDLVLSEQGENAKDKLNKLQNAITKHYQALFAQAKKLNTQKLPVVATGHLTALGVSTSSSERDIYIGTLEAFPASAFPEFNYIALGHIHRPQMVAKSQHIAYCGSPIALSFDELSGKKQVNLVSFDQNNCPELTVLPVPQFQPMQFVRGSWLSVQARLTELVTESSSLLWLSVEIVDDKVIADVQGKLNQIIADSQVEILQIKQRSPKDNSGLTKQHDETLAELSPKDVFLKRLALEDVANINDDEKQRFMEMHQRLITELQIQAEQE